MAEGGHSAAALPRPVDRLIGARRCSQLSLVPRFVLLYASRSINTYAHTIEVCLVAERSVGTLGGSAWWPGMT
jgi:hypothetical protein